MEFLNIKSGKISPLWDPSETSNLISLDQEEAKSELLSKQVDSCITNLEVGHRLLAVYLALQSVQELR